MSQSGANSGSPGITHANVEDAYARWAPVYDRVFTLILKPGRVAAAAEVNRIGGRLLDVGVGTGIELPMFDKPASIVGIDLSQPMLDIAQRRVSDMGLKNVEALIAMDAMNLTFEDESFDCAVAPYVITTVPDPEKTMDEMARVVKRGGELIIVNHIAKESGPIAGIERALAKRTAKLGWRPTFPWSIIGDWVASRPDLELVERRTLKPMGLFALIRIVKK